MAISKQCKFELKAHADKIQKEKGVSRLEVLKQLANETDQPLETVRTQDRRAKEELVQNEPKPVTTSNNSQSTISNAVSSKSNRGGSRPGAGKKKIITFNETNDNIEWARWTWNPVTGCEHGCPYCYARDIANRFYKEKFKPTFHPERLVAPQNTKIPKGKEKEPGIQNVFVCSMADLFGDWVQKEWIRLVFKAIKEAPQWNFILLTKNPKRYLNIPNWSENIWIGATADTQERANVALKVFSEIRKQNKSAADSIMFLSCEPLKEWIDLKDNQTFIDWLIIGGQSKTTGEPEAQPNWKWVESLLTQGRRSNISVYFKPNLTVRPREYPKIN